MQMIHTSFKKRKPKKPNAKQRELQAEWEKLLSKYEPKKKLVMVNPLPKPKAYIRETEKIPSLPFTAEPCTKKETQRYTGTAMKGIGTMHKSNSVPIFSNEEAVAIATMRRN